MELELKHLAPYLPYSLSCYLQGHKDEDDKPIKETILGLYDQTETEVFVTLNETDYETYKIFDVFPVLRPLSCVLEIKEFAHIHTMIKHHIGRTRLERMLHEGYGMVDLPYFITEYFFENHIDYFDLIGKGLAVDINSIEK